MNTCRYVLALSWFSAEEMSGKDMCSGLLGHWMTAVGKSCGKNAKPWKRGAGWLRGGDGGVGEGGLGGGGGGGGGGAMGAGVVLRQRSPPRAKLSHLPVHKCEGGHC